VLAALLLASGSALAAKPKPGHFSGTTDQGRPIDFKVKKKGKKKRKAGSVELDIGAQCPIGSAFAQGTLPGFDTVSKKGRFSLDFVPDFGETVDVDGEFTSRTSAVGTLRWTWDSPDGFCDSGTVNWQAQRG
jgi:hypothetical protein